MEKYVDHKAGSSITLGSTVFALNLIACRTFASSKASLSHMLTSHPGLALLCCDYVFAITCGVHLLFGQFGRTYINLCSDKCHKCLENVQCPTAISSPVMAHKVHQNDHSYVCELSGPTFKVTTQEFSKVGGYMEDFQKATNRRVGTCPGQYSKGSVGNTPLHIACKFISSLPQNLKFKKRHPPLNRRQGAQMAKYRIVLKFQGTKYLRIGL